ncbi:nucleic-acid-binding protein from transposon X-element [Trichonephila clavipes]|nr:nucleic-acid-binding protein from transposon X-element [Trichonephila clavipes]
MMKNSDMEFSPNSRSNSSSRSSTPKPEKPLTDCEIRRNAMERLHHQKTMIAGYKNYLNNPMTWKDVPVRKEMKTTPDNHSSQREIDKNSILKTITEDIKTNDNDKKPPQKRRKNTKSNSDDFVFPSKTARPTTPTKVLEPVEVQNSYDNLVEDPEINVTETNDKPAPSPPQPISLKIKDNYRDQLNKIMQKFPNLKSKSSGKHIKLNTDCHFEHQEITDFMDEDRDIEFYVFKPKETKPIKVVVKGLPGCTKPNEIVSDLEDQGYTVTSANQLISKRTKLELPFFLITMPRNEFNLTVFDLTHLGYMQVRIEGYFVHGITQCFNCNNFYHTAANCHMITRCLKCGKEHPTKDCDIKERQENPYCINCNAYGHTACYTKFP